MTKRAKRVLQTILAALAVGVPVSVALDYGDDERFTDLSCAEAIWLAEELQEMGEATVAQMVEPVRAQCPDVLCKWDNDFSCHNGLLYGPGTGGVNDKGEPMLCSMIQGPRPCEWVPHQVPAGMDPDKLAKKYRR